MHNIHERMSLSCILLCTIQLDVLADPSHVCKTKRILGESWLYISQKSVKYALQLVALHFEFALQLCQFCVANCDAIPLILFPENVSEKWVNTSVWNMEMKLIIFIKFLV